MKTNLEKKLLKICQKLLQTKPLTEQIQNKDKNKLRVIAKSDLIKDLYLLQNEKNKRWKELVIFFTNEKEKLILTFQQKLKEIDLK